MADKKAQTADAANKGVAGSMNGAGVYAEGVDSGISEACQQGGYVGAGSARPRAENGEDY